MNRYVASRWVIRKHLIFPREVFVEKYHVRTRKRSFPFFWIVNEESIPLTKVASIKIHKGLLFSDLIIENSGGDFPITIDGFTNAVALKLRHDLESRERHIYRHTAERERSSGKESEPIEIDDGFAWDEEYEVTLHGVK